jgi:hypothetical protein
MKSSGTLRPGRFSGRAWPREARPEGSTDYESTQQQDTQARPGFLPDTQARARAVSARAIQALHELSRGRNREGPRPHDLGIVWLCLIRSGDRARSRRRTRARDELRSRVRRFGVLDRARLAVEESEYQYDGRGEHYERRVEVTDHCRLIIPWKVKPAIPAMATSPSLTRVSSTWHARQAHMMTAIAAMATQVVAVSDSRVDMLGDSESFYRE